VAQPAVAAEGTGEDEEFQPDRNRWVVIGCGALTLLLCCALVVGVIMVDQTKSWCSLPFIGPLVGCP
jgi:hypothetical protein